MNDNAEEHSGEANNMINIKEIMHKRTQDIFEKWLAMGLIKTSEQLIIARKRFESDEVNPYGAGK